MQVRVGSDLELEDTDYGQSAKFNWKEFYNFRNHVVQVLTRFGSVGPCGEANLSVADEDAPDFKGNAVLDPDFFVVEDMYNEHDQISIVECDVKFINAEVIHSIVEMASAFPGWRVVINMGDSGLRIFGDRVLVGGRRFWDCTTIEEVGQRCGMPVEFGSAPFVEPMYPLWVDVICGAFRSSRFYATPQVREWKEVLHVLEQMASRSKGVAVPPNTYERIRYDLHPLTRREFVGRLFSEAGSLPAESLRAAKQNLIQEAADGLRIGGDEDRRRFAALVSEGQRAAANALDPKEVVFWWPYIVDAIKEPTEPLSSILEAELRKLLSDPNQWVRLFRSEHRCEIGVLHQHDLAGAC